MVAGSYGPDSYALAGDRGLVLPSEGRPRLAIRLASLLVCFAESALFLPSGARSA